MDIDKYFDHLASDDIRIKGTRIGIVIWKIGYPGAPPLLRQNENYFSTLKEKRRGE